jgi:thiamine-phosphate pyrophosphorylase
VIHERPASRTPLDLALYLVTDPELCGAHGVVPTAAAAVAAGATAVQLRDPRASDADFVRTGVALRKELAGTGVPLIVNDRVHLVEAVGAAGAHVGQHDMDPLAAREVLGPDAHLGLSMQAVSHVEAALTLPAGTVDYVGAGPVWGQTTKTDAVPPIGLGGLEAITGASPWPCVVIGGVDAECVPHARRHGAVGVAVVSAICGRTHVAAATRALRTAWERSSSP